MKVDRTQCATHPGPAGQKTNPSLLFVAALVILGFLVAFMVLRPNHAPVTTKSPMAPTSSGR